MNEFHGKTLAEVIKKSLHREQIIKHGNRPGLSVKGRFLVWAPPIFWGPWVQIWAQVGVLGPDKEKHQSIINVSFETQSDAPSTFDVEIKGGDNFIRTIGPGSKRVVVTGNVATAISIRCKSHLLGQQVVVTI